MKRVRIIFRRLNAEQIDFLSEENASYSYDENDQLYYSQTGDNITNIKYSADGYRYYKRENSTAPEFYVYDIQGKLQSIVRPVIASDDTSVFSMMYATQNYIWDNTKVLAQIDNLNGKTYYYLYNGHGDVVQIVDTAGNIVNQYDYDVWGNFITKEETIENHFTYFGQTYDETTGLYYLRARYYDPTTGRFTQQDPAEDGYNWYVYGNQNPVRFVDPKGEAGTEVAATMLIDAFIGDGKTKDYSYNREVVQTFYSSPLLNKVVDARFEEFKKMNVSSYTFSDSLGFYGNDWNPNDLDLHLAVGKAEYTMKFTKENVTKRFLWKTWTETVYSVKITISDTYNFDEYREATSISNRLNNWGYDMQKKGKLTPYFWSVTFMKKGL